MLRSFQAKHTPFGEKVPINPVGAPSWPNKITCRRVDKRQAGPWFNEPHPCRLCKPTFFCRPKNEGTFPRRVAGRFLHSASQLILSRCYVALNVYLFATPRNWQRTQSPIPRSRKGTDLRRIFLLQPVQPGCRLLRRFSRHPGWANRRPGCQQSYCLGYRD